MIGDCFNDPDPFGAGAEIGDPVLAKSICAKCPVDKDVCLDGFVELHGTTHGVSHDFTVAGLSGTDLRRAIAKRLNNRRRAA